MADSTRTSLWLAGVAVVGGLIVWAFSWSGVAFARIALSIPLPDWLSPFERGGLLAWEALGLLVAFLLVVLCVRRFGAPPQLWLGALATSLLLGGRYLTGFVELSRMHAIEGWHDLWYAFPFSDPLVALLALAGLPVVVGLACWLGRRRGEAPVAVPEADVAAHA